MKKNILIITLLGLLFLAAQIKPTKTTTVLCKSYEVDATITRYCKMGYSFKDAIILNSEMTGLYYATTYPNTAYIKPNYLLIFQL